jgi:hypothetical protein
MGPVSMAMNLPVPYNAGKSSVAEQCLHIIGGNARRKGITKKTKM